MDSKLEPPIRAIPWATVVIFVAASLALWLPRLSEGLIYERSLILSGQIWRVWTGHTVHFGLNHFFWDMTVFLPTGIWLERLWPRQTRRFYFLCPLVISIALVVMDPSLDRYAGISGVAAGALALLAGLQLRRKSSEPAWFWLAILGLLAAKIGAELIGGTSFLIGMPESVRVVPLAHIGGLVCGLGFLVNAPPRRS